LVERLIEDGERLLRALDNRKVPLSAIFWFYDLDRSAWNLIIVTSVAGIPGPFEAYSQIQSAMAGLDLSFSLNDILVISPQSREFERLKRNLEGVVGSAGIRPKDPSKGTAFDDAYIYRWLD
jgi:hypothetical protein